MEYKLGKRSLSELKGVHPDLVRVVKAAIKITNQDFTVLDGVRTEAEQQELVVRGASQTMDSKHLPQADGKAHAVDLVPWINGRARWELDPCLVVARAVQKASRDLGVEVVWGGAWMTLGLHDPGLMLEDYQSRCRRRNRRPFVDAVHFELAQVE